MSHSQSFRELKDYDVLGIGAIRRAELESANAVGRCVLQIYRGLIPNSRVEIYEELLRETVDWLKPHAVVEEKFLGSAEEFIYFLLLAEMRKVFPQTLASISEDPGKLLRVYMTEVPWQGPLLTDHFRFFPRFLKTFFRDEGLAKIAEHEWLWSYLQFADFGEPRPEAGRIVANPSLQTFYVQAALPASDLGERLSICYYDSGSRKVREHKMQIIDAAVVDALQEDRKYTLDQLIAEVRLGRVEALRDENSVRKRVHFLIEQGILLMSDTKEN